MESLEEYISPFTGDFAEVPEDYDENGEMNEQGKKKLEKLKKIIEIMQEYEKVDSRKLEIYKKKLEDHYDLTENEWQEKLKTILADHKREEDFKTEDQFDSFTLNINFQKEDHKKMFSDLLTTRVPKIHTLYLAYISKDDIENLKTFLVKSFPHRLETLVFNFSGHPKSKDDLLDLEPFIDLLVDISALVDSEIQIWNCSIKLYF